MLWMQDRLPGIFQRVFQQGAGSVLLCPAVSFSSAACWESSTAAADRNRLNKVIRKAGEEDTSQTPMHGRIIRTALSATSWTDLWRRGACPPKVSDSSGTFPENVRCLHAPLLFPPPACLSSPSPPPPPLAAISRRVPALLEVSSC